MHTCASAAEGAGGLPALSTPRSGWLGLGAKLGRVPGEGGGRWGGPCSVGAASAGMKGH